MSVFDVLFVISTVLILYIFAGYPVLVGILARIFPQKHQKDDAFEPSVTLIISAYNEENVIRSKLENSLALDYPHEKLNVVVVSDSSTDETDAIVQEYVDRGVTLIRPSERRGKTAALNLALEQVHSDILVFSDANAIYDQLAVRNLVRHFADQAVGYAVGFSQYVDVASSAAARSEGLYWNLEIFLKKSESDFSSVVGGDGALYAIRRELWEPLELTDINDFVNPLQIVAKGYRGIFDPEALCAEAPAGEFKKEYSRKVRIVNRSFSGLLRVPAVLNPFRVGRFALLVISHKLLRWLSPFILILHFISTLGAAGNSVLGSIPAMSAALYVVMGILALIGYWQDSRGKASSKITYLPYYFYLMNVASACGVWIRIKGTTITTWETVRERTDSTSFTESMSVLPLVSILVLVFGSTVVRAGSAELLISLMAYGLIFLICYVFVGYPVFLYFVSRFFKVNTRRDEDYQPTVTLLIAAFNEEKVIEEKLVNSLELDYPVERLRILIASDGSTDKTNTLVKEYEDRGVELLAFAQNRGKASALNDALEQITSEIVVFSDANAMYDSQSLRKLTRHFIDQRVGGVSGKVVLLNEAVSYGRSEESYYSIEHFIQEKEGETGTLVGSDGAMYAIRRELFRTLPAETILDDFAISMNIMCQGFFLLHDREARGYEVNQEEVKGEFRRKTRIIAGGIQFLRKGKLIPSIDQSLLFFNFLSHKLLRWFLGPISVMLLLILAGLQLFATGAGWFLTMTFYGFCFCLAVSVAGHLMPAWRRLAPVNMIHYIFMLELASLVGCYKGFTGRQAVTWRRD